MNLPVIRARESLHLVGALKAAFAEKPEGIERLILLAELGDDETRREVVYRLKREQLMQRQKSLSR